MGRHLKTQEPMQMLNDTEECIEYVVQEGAGGVRAPGINCAIRPEHWVEIDSGKSSAPLQLNHSRVVILNNIPPGTQIVFRSQKPAAAVTFEESDTVASDTVASNQELEFADVQDVSEDFLSDKELAYYLDLENL